MLIHVGSKGSTVFFAYGNHLVHTVHTVHFGYSQVRHIHSIVALPDIQFRIFCIGHLRLSPTEYRSHSLS